MMSSVLPNRVSWMIHNGVRFMKINYFTELKCCLSGVCDGEWLYYKTQQCRFYGKEVRNSNSSFFCFWKQNIVSNLPKSSNISKEPKVGLFCAEM